MVLLMSGLMEISRGGLMASDIELMVQHSLMLA